jgi:hypothetical protein
VAVKLFTALAVRLNNFENHQTQTVYMNRLILKVFAFRFITVFTSLYYYAFFMNLDTTQGNTPRGRGFITSYHGPLKSSIIHPYQGPALANVIHPHHPIP